MEIEVGEWIRTEDGKIDKIIAIHNEEDCTIVVCKKKYWKEDISKHSKDIKKLIEVGDYVNGSMVHEILEDGRVHIMSGFLLENADIKTVVTHEQFQSIEYKVEEDK